MPDFASTIIQNITQIVYFISALMLIFGLKKMNSPTTARKGLSYAAIGLLIAVLITYFHHEVHNNYLWMTVALIVGASLAYILSQASSTLKYQR